MRRQLVVFLLIIVVLSVVSTLAGCARDPMHMPTPIALYTREPGSVAEQRARSNEDTAIDGRATSTVAEETAVVTAVATPPAVLSEAVPADTPMAVEAFDLLDASISGQGLGSVATLKDLVIDLAEGRLLFATVEHGGILSLGSRIVPVPVQALRWQPDRTALTMDLSRWTLASVRGFEGRWPYLERPEWTTDLLETWQQIEPTWLTTSPLDDPSAMSGTIVKATELKGKQVLNPSGETEATVDDLLIDLEAGELVYLILAQSANGRDGTRYYAVPLSAFEFNGDLQKPAMVLGSPVEGRQDTLPYSDPATPIR